MNSLDKIRTDTVGSLLRPRAWTQARLQLEAGTLSQEAFRRIEDQEITKLVHLQEQIGLDVVTDGEMRRLDFMESFLASVQGYEAKPDGLTHLIEQEKAPRALSRPRVLERLRLGRNLPLEEYKFVSQIAQEPAKVTFIGPDRIAQRFDYQSATTMYSGLDEFTANVVTVQREIIAGLVDAGCKYIHVDAPGYTAYVDPAAMEAMRSRGEDPQDNFARSLRADTDLVNGFDGVTFGIHICRGNDRSRWYREGSYDAIAERLFSELPHQRFLLEYDSPRAGGFAPLRFVPKDKVVVLGLVSTKVPELESVDELKRRIDEATKYLPLNQLAISPQCGFASSAMGNLLSEDDQKRKLERVLETARQVWG